MDENSPVGVPSQAPKSSGLGMAMSITGLVLGILCLILSFVPCVGALALWPGVLSTVISIVGYININPKGLGIAALVVSLASVGFAIYQRGQIVEAVKDTEKELEKLGKDIEKELKNKVN